MTSGRICIWRYGVALSHSYFEGIEKCDLSPMENRNSCTEAIPKQYIPFVSRVSCGENPEYSDGDLIDLTAPLGSKENPKHVD